MRLKGQPVASFRRCLKSLAVGIASSRDRRGTSRKCASGSPRTVRLYLYNYRHLSDSVHPSFRTAAYHLPADANGELVGLARDSPTTTDDQLTLPLAFSAIFATNAIASLSQNPDHLTAINDVADRYELPRDLTSDDQMPELRRERH